MRGGGGRNGRALTWEDSEKAPAQSGPMGGGVAHNMVQGREGGRKREEVNAVMEGVEGFQGGGRRGSAVYTEEDLTICQMLQGRRR